MPERFYEDEDAEEILRMATHRSVGGISHENLIATAAELGISAEAVEQAAYIQAKQKEDRTLRREYDRQTRARFFSHLWSYLIVNAGLVAMNLVTSRHIDWVIWPILGWGIGLASNFQAAFFRKSADYEEEFRKWKRKRGMSTAQLAEQFLLEHPNDRKGAVDYLHHQFDIKRSEAKEVVDRHLTG